MSRPNLGADEFPPNTEMPGTIAMRASQSKPGGRVITRWVDVNGFHCSADSLRLNLKTEVQPRMDTDGHRYQANEKFDRFTSQVNSLAISYPCLSVFIRG